MGEEYLWELGIFSVLATILIGVPYIISIVWSYNDAKKRGTSGVIVALLVAFAAWPFSLIGWLILRPKKQEYQHR